MWKVNSALLDKNSERKNLKKEIFPRSSDVSTYQIERITSSVIRATLWRAGYTCLSGCAITFVDGAKACADAMR